jgi:hypothetical protein
MKEMERIENGEDSNTIKTLVLLRIGNKIFRDINNILNL